MSFLVASAFLFQQAAADSAALHGARSPSWAPDGRVVVSVDGDGTVRRCHFVPRTDPAEHLGTLYDGSFRAKLRPRPCPLEQCDCHIGYVHMPELGLYDTFRGGVLERVPAVALALAPSVPPLPRA